MTLFADILTAAKQINRERGKNMKILITGASSGIGRDIARKAASRYDELVLVGRNEERLEALRQELTKLYNVKAETYVTDLSNYENCVKLFEAHRDVHLLVNNAGFGDVGVFDKTSLEKDIMMINTNITAMHILMKLYIGEMKKRNSGHILNTASMAGFFPGPLMATYYATKAYVVSLSRAVREELRREGSKVTVSILCPGPVATGFGKAANVDFHFSYFSKNSRYIADYAMEHLPSFYIIPGIEIKAAKLLSRILPSSVSAAVIYNIQNNKVNK